MNRDQTFSSLDGTFDIVVIGGGATGLGVALDSVTRGFRTALVEAGDFAQATSSRSTKLVHGGVRYLASGQVHLVYEALHERKVMLNNAPHLVQPLGFGLPVYSYFGLFYYGIGLKLYDLLAGRASLGSTKVLFRNEAMSALPNLAGERDGRKLRGCILYYDGQFDDARLSLAIAQTAAEKGAAVLNYTQFTRFVKQDGKISGVVVRDLESGSEQTIQAKTVINAAGIFSDEVRSSDDAAAGKLLSVSRGIHIVVDKKFMNSENAIMIPKTDDGRVLFAIPWQDHVIIGTTDVAAPRAEMEPGYTEAEVSYLIEHINRYLAHPVARADVSAVFSGLRPLVTGKAASTSKLSREHHLEISGSGLVTIVGGKWTTYRRMAEDTIDFAIRSGKLPAKKCVSRGVKLRGAEGPWRSSSPALRQYGTEAAKIEALMREDQSLANRIHPRLPHTFAQVVFAARSEMARTVEDVLARRMRALFVDAQASIEAAPAVAQVLAHELQRSPEWVESQVKEFTRMAELHYTISSSPVPESRPGATAQANRLAHI